jgi:hypothetical protein
MRHPHPKTRQLAATLLMTTLVLPMAACMTDGRARLLDQKFAAGWRPTKGYCAFGGETPALSAWCAEVNFGGESLALIARTVNEKVLARAAGQPLACTDHVAQARRELTEFPDYTVTELYSCDANPPLENGRPVCHVSLMVANATGDRVVLDNGHVFEPATTAGVGSFQEFAQLVDRHWAGEQPAWVALASE